MSDKHCIKKLLILFKPYKWTILFIIICLFISMGINMFIPLLNRDIMDKGFLSGNINFLIKAVIIVFSLYVFDVTLGIVKEKKRVKIAADLKFNLTTCFFRHLIRIKIDYFNNTNYAEILNRIDMDVSAVSSIADERLFFVLTKIFSMIGGIVGLCILDVRLTIIVVLFIPIKFLVMKYFTKVRKKIYSSYINVNRRFSLWFGDTMGGVREIRLFGVVDKKETELSQLQTEIVKSDRDINMISTWTGAVDNILIKFLQTCIYIVGATMVFKDNLTIGSVFAFLTYSSYVTDPIISILNISYLLAGVIPSAKRFFEFMDNDEEDVTGLEMEEIDIGDIVFKDVSFAYDDEKNILENLNFRIPKSSKVALVGMNGVGKTSIINLILRMYDVKNGEILIRDKNISSFSLESYRNHISIVSQQIYLFNDSIRNNIKLYKDVTDEIIMQAVEDCGLAEFIIEKTLDYQIGENGLKLSGGQRQKIAFARALVHEKPILILDEATSNSDIYSEAKINKLFNSKLKNRTIIIVTHKTEVLKDVDNILFLGKNKTSYFGTYENLYSISQEFKDIIDKYSQFSKEK